MSRPLCSVVMATYQRSHLLARSLRAYESQDFDRDNFEMIVIDDHSTDGTREMVLDWSRTTKIAATVLTTAPKPESWRDCGAILNAGIRASAGEHIILTHPEVIPGKRSVAALVDKLEDWEEGGGTLVIGLYVACRIYYLRPRDQELLDSVPWERDGVLAVRQIPGFYDEDMRGNSDYRHCVTDQVAKPGFKIQTWDSWVFGGCSRDTWKRLGGMRVTQKWGSVDILFNDRRKKLKMAEWTCPDDDTICIHQNHDGPENTQTPRVEQVWKDELGAMDLAKLCYPEVDELGWGG